MEVPQMRMFAVQLIKEISSAGKRKKKKKELVGSYIFCHQHLLINPEEPPRMQTYLTKLLAAVSFIWMHKCTPL